MILLSKVFSSAALKDILGAAAIAALKNELPLADVPVLATELRPVAGGAIEVVFTLADRPEEKATTGKGDAVAAGAPTNAELARRRIEARRRESARRKAAANA